MKSDSRLTTCTTEQAIMAAERANVNQLVGSSISLKQYVTIERKKKAGAIMYTGLMMSEKYPDANMTINVLGIETSEI